MAKFCGKCGALVENGVCPKCGAEYQGTAPFVLYKCREKARNKIKIHIIINCILWICIGALQLFDIYYIRGMFNIEIFKYIQYQHAFGAWNIAISICEISEYVCIQMGKKSCNYIDCMYFKFAYR